LAKRYVASLFPLRFLWHKLLQFTTTGPHQYVKMVFARDPSRSEPSSPVVPPTNPPTFFPQTLTSWQLEYNTLGSVVQHSALLAPTINNGHGFNLNSHDASDDGEWLFQSLYLH
jgi:hypothetical protein